MDPAPTITSTRPVSDLPPGEQRGIVFTQGALLFSRLSLLRPLGEGRCSNVWLAEDARFRREIAVKFFASGPVETARETRTVWHELMRRLRILNHRHIAMPLEFFTGADWSAITSSYVQGQTLAQMLAGKPGHKLLYVAARPILLQIGQALLAAHVSAKVVHGNLNLCNVMVGDDGLARITDFGFYPAITTTDPGDALLSQKLGALSPERLREEGPSFASDIFSFGALCFQVLTGGNPAINEADGPSANEQTLQTVSDLPTEWSRQILASLENNPFQRPPSLQAMLEEMGGVDMQRDATPSPVSPIPRTSRKRNTSKHNSRRASENRRRWIKILSILCALALPVVLTITISSYFEESRRLQEQRARDEQVEKIQADLEKTKLKELEDRVLNNVPRIRIAESIPPSVPTPPPTSALPINSEALQFYQEGQARAQAGDHVGAFQSYEMASVLMSDWPDLLEARGDTLLKLDRAEQAVEEYSKTLALQPDRVTAMLGRAAAYARAKSTALARKDYQTVLKLKPDSEAARQGLESLVAH